MKKCPACAYETNEVGMRCPECGSFYSKIIELIEQEAAAEEQQGWQGLCRRVLQAADKKQVLQQAFSEFKAGLTLKAKFTLWLIFAFVFALIVIVL